MGDLRKDYVVDRFVIVSQNGTGLPDSKNARIVQEMSP